MWVATGSKALTEPEGVSGAQDLRISLTLKTTALKGSRDETQSDPQESDHFQAEKKMSCEGIEMHYEATTREDGNWLDVALEMRRMDASDQTWAHLLKKSM